MWGQMADVYPSIYELFLTVSHDDQSVVGPGCDDQFEFEFALDLMLDGLERAKAASTGRRRHATHRRVRTEQGPLRAQAGRALRGDERREGRRHEGPPIIVLTSVGAKSGKLRKTPLMRVEHDGTYAVVASLGGAPEHPVWYFNLKANPHVELQDLATKRDYTAREVTGDEKALWWDRAVEAWPDYANYRTETDRKVPGLRPRTGRRQREDAVSRAPASGIEERRDERHEETACNPMDTCDAPGITASSAMPACRAACRRTPRHRATGTSPSMACSGRTRSESPMIRSVGASIAAMSSSRWSW